MRAPGFWRRPPGLAAALLAPAAAIYGAVAAHRLRQPGVRAALPVLCVGNVTVGGSGKTPTAIALAALLFAAGRRPAFLTRGYGGREPGPLLVDPARHGAGDVGDEALLLARVAPTIVSRDRPAGAALAAAGGASIVIMDDGLQNPSLHKDATLAVFDGGAGIGNGRVLPAGPLRAPLPAQWERIDAALIVGAGKAGDALALEAGHRGLPVVRARLEPDPDAVAALAGRRILAFAGIGDPDKFLRTCRESGLEIAKARRFADHHPYTAAQVGRLLDEAERAGLVPVTTEKDLVRLARLGESEPRLGLVRALPVALRFEDDAPLRRLLARLLPGSGA